MVTSYTVIRIITQESGDASVTPTVFTSKNGGINAAKKAFHDEISDAISKQRYCDTVVIVDQFGAYVEDPYIVQAGSQA